MPDMPVYSVKAHKEILNSIDGVGGLGIGDGAPEIVTGSRDGESSNLTEHSRHVTRILINFTISCGSQEQSKFGIQDRRTHL